jgi:hypothetical protein
VLPANDRPHEFNENNQWWHKEQPKYSIQAINYRDVDKLDDASDLDLPSLDSVQLRRKSMSTHETLLFKKRHSLIHQNQSAKVNNLIQMEKADMLGIRSGVKD